MAYDRLIGSLRVGVCGHAGAQLAQLPNPRLHVWTRLIWQLAQCSRIRAVQLDRSQREPALIEVQTRTQRELLAQEHAAAPGQEQGKALLWAQHARALAGSSTREHELARVAPEAVGDLLALAEAGAH